MIPFNIAIFLTLTRILIIPLLVVVFYAPQWFSMQDAYAMAHKICAVLFTVAALTDWLDGYVARRFNQETRLGALIDPIADKMIVAVALLLIVERFNSWAISLPAMVIITRELAVSGLREWMASESMRDIVAVDWFGKIKTVLQVGSIILLLWGLPLPSEITVSGAVSGAVSGVAVVRDITIVGLVMLYIASILTLYSMFYYLFKAKRALSRRKS